ncbi:DUF481 domain-containing protein, partial [Pontibacter diazotrophicus]
MRNSACLFFLVLVAFFVFNDSPVVAQQTGTGTPLQADSLLQARADSLKKPQFLVLDTLSYRFFGDGSFTQGNVNRSLMVLRAEVTVGGPVISIATNPRFSYGRQNNVVAERDTYVDLFIDVFKKRKTYLFGLGTIEISNLRGIDLRQLVGAGVGY